MPRRCPCRRSYSTGRRDVDGRLGRQGSDSRAHWATPSLPVRVPCAVDSVVAVAGEMRDVIGQDMVALGLTREPHTAESKSLA